MVILFLSSLSQSSGIYINLVLETTLSAAILTLILKSPSDLIFKSPLSSYSSILFNCLVLSENINNSHIKKIFLFVEKEEDIPSITSDKIEIIEVENRQVFQDLIDYANEELEGERCIISNSDIILNNSLVALVLVDFSDLV